MCQALPLGVCGGRGGGGGHSSILRRGENRGSERSVHIAMATQPERLGAKPGATAVCHGSHGSHIPSIGAGASRATCEMYRKAAQGPSPALSNGWVILPSGKELYRGHALDGTGIQLRPPMVLPIRK